MKLGAETERHHTETANISLIFLKISSKSNLRWHRWGRGSPCCKRRHEIRNQIRPSSRAILNRRSMRRRAMSSGPIDLKKTVLGWFYQWSKGQLVYWHSEVFKLFELVKLKSKAFWVMLGICRVELSNQSIVLIEPSCLISIETFLVIWRVWSIHGLLSW